MLGESQYVPLRALVFRVFIVAFALCVACDAHAQSKKKLFDPNSSFGGGFTGQFDQSASSFAEPATITAGFTTATADHGRDEREDQG